MLVLLSTYGSRGDAGPMVGLAVRWRALGALVAARFDTVAAAAEGCDAPVVTGVTPARVWR